MNPIHAQSVINQAIRKRKKRKSFHRFSPGYKKAMQQRVMLIKTRRMVKDAFWIISGIISASFGFKGFLLTNHFIDGGATGISLLLSATTHVPIWAWIACINIPFIILAFSVIGRQFAIKTILSVSGLALCLAAVHFPNVTDDKLLVAVFGGFFLGAGIGLAMRGGAVLDGTEVLAIFLSRKFSITIGDVIIVINVLIFSAAAFLLSVEIALYSMITYLAASKTLDFLIEGIEEYIGVTIISRRHEQIRDMIIHKMGRGVTIYKGRGGYGKTGTQQEIDILYTVLTRLEINKLNAELEKTDRHAFVVMSRIKDTKGGMIKKRPLH